MLQVKIIFEENNITNLDSNDELNLTINTSISQEEDRLTLYKMQHIKELI